MNEFDFGPGLRIEERIDGAEHEGITARWEFGKWMAEHADPETGRLPHKFLAGLAEATGKSRQELDYRRRFAVLYATETKVSNALDTFGSWHQLIRDGLRAEAGERNTETPPPPEGTYRTLVIDPPWPVETVDRDVRQDQPTGLPYNVESVADIRRLLSDDVPVTDIADDAAHLYLWVTHKYLPAGLDLLAGWGFDYQCVLTWVKNVGITPFSWMYSTEHVLFGHRGGLKLAALGKRLDFAANITEHSRKPDEFYELVRDVSPGPRLDMFARGPHEGFEVWGNETTRFADAA